MTIAKCLFEIERDKTVKFGVDTLEGMARWQVDARDRRAGSEIEERGKGPCINRWTAACRPYPGLWSDERDYTPDYKVRWRREVGKA